MKNIIASAKDGQEKFDILQPNSTLTSHGQTKNESLFQSVVLKWECKYWSNIKLKASFQDVVCCQNNFFSIFITFTFFYRLIQGMLQRRVWCESQFIGLQQTSWWCLLLLWRKQMQQRWCARFWKRRTAVLKWPYMDGGIREPQKIVSTEYWCLACFCTLLTLLLISKCICPFCWNKKSLKYYVQNLWRR